MMDSAQQIADSVRGGRRTARSVVEETLAKLPHAHTWNTFTTVNANQALRRADHIDSLNNTQRAALLLAGVPITVKDNIAVDGFALTGGSPALISYKPETTATCVQHAINAGAIVIGKTNLHELAFGITGANPHFGNAMNPKNPGTLVGGSSSGAALSVALGLVPIAFGTDTGGSIRVPAALTGTVGYRPSTGRWANDGVLTLSPTRDTVGVIANDVSDLFLIDEVICGRPNVSVQDVPQTLRLAVLQSPYAEGLADTIRIAWEASVNRLRLAGHEIVYVDASSLAGLDADIGLPIAVVETAEVWTKFCADQLGCGLGEFADRLASSDVRMLFQAMARGEIPSRGDYETAMLKLGAIRDVHASFFEQYRVNALLMPATMRQGVTPEEAEITQIAGVPVPTFPTFIRQTSPASLVGAPSIALPGIPLAGGIPAGILIEGPVGKDLALLGVGQRILRDLGL